jgi:hypothetical protein
MKDIYKNIPMLDMNDPAFIEKFKTAAGLEDGEVLHIITPQFTRTDGINPTRPIVPFEELHTLPEAKLKEIGCMKWDDPDAEGNVLWLVPGEWYEHIPEGTEMMCISGERELFKRGVTDDDIRCGCLAYGFLRKKD